MLQLLGVKPKPKVRPPPPDLSFVNEQSSEEDVAMHLSFSLGEKSLSNSSIKGCRLPGESEIEEEPSEQHPAGNKKM